MGSSLGVPALLASPAAGVWQPRQALSTARCLLAAEICLHGTVLPLDSLQTRFRELARNFISSNALPFFFFFLKQLICSRMVLNTLSLLR